MDADGAEVMSETRLEEGASLRVERVAGRAQYVMNDRRHGHRPASAVREALESLPGAAFAFATGGRVRTAGALALRQQATSYRRRGRFHRQTETALAHGRFPASRLRAAGFFADAALCTGSAAWKASRSAASSAPMFTQASPRYLAKNGQLVASADGKCPPHSPLLRGGAAVTLVYGFSCFALRDAGSPAWIFVAIVLSLIPHDMMYGPQAALIAESFTGRLRYSGASLGYQLASAIAGYIAGCAVVSLVSTALLPDYTNKDISKERFLSHAPS